MRIRIRMHSKWWNDTNDNVNEKKKRIMNQARILERVLRSWGKKIGSSLLPAPRLPTTENEKKKQNRIAQTRMKLKKWEREKKRKKRKTNTE